MNDITQEMNLIFSCLHCSNSFSVQQGLNDDCIQTDLFANVPMYKIATGAYGDTFTH